MVEAIGRSGGEKVVEEKIIMDCYFYLM